MSGELKMSSSSESQGKTLYHGMRMLNAQVKLYCRNVKLKILFCYGCTYGLIN